MTSITKSPALVVAGLLAPLCAFAQTTVLIDANTRNGSFELVNGEPSTAKVQHWDTDPNGNVDNWTLWDSVAANSNDSGTEVPASTRTGQEGNRVAFLQNQNAVYNLTDWVVQEGDIFSYQWNWIMPGRTDAEVGLAFWDGDEIVSIAGTTTVNPDTDTEHLDIGTTYTAVAGDPAIGNQIALTIFSPSSGYPEVDNFRLTVIPEPSTYAMIFGALALGGVLLIRRRRKS